MQEYGFSLSCILPCKDRIRRFCPYTGEHGSVKTRILTNFTQWDFELLIWKIKKQSLNLDL